MVEANGSHASPMRSSTVVRTAEFERWTRTLDAERTAKVSGAIERVARGGPTLGRPRVDVIHGSRVPKLKEAQERIAHVLYRRDVSHDDVLEALDAVDEKISDGFADPLKRARSPRLRYRFGGWRAAGQRLQRPLLICRFRRLVVLEVHELARIL